MRAAIVALCVLLAGRVAAEPAAASEEGRVDPLGLASLLVRDGHVDRAAAVLAEVAPDDPAVDRAKLLTLRGLVALKLGEHQAAADDLMAAQASGQTEPAVWLLLAQARRGLGDAAGVLEALDGAGEAAWQHEGTVLMRAQAAWELGELARAWEALTEGIRRFPDNGEMARRQVVLLVELGLFEEAREQGQAYLARGSATVEDHLAVAEALRQGRRPLLAASALEAAILRFGPEEGLVTQLARAYADAEKPRTAGEILARASVAQPDLAVEAAEVFRRAGLSTSAVLANARVVDQREKVRQRLGLLIDVGRFEQAAALEERLGRLGLLHDDPVRYAVAYAYFRTGRYKDAERHLKRISDAALFEQAAGLRKAMEVCRGEGALCD